MLSLHRASIPQLFLLYRHVQTCLNCTQPAVINIVLPKRGARNGCTVGDLGMEGFTRRIVKAQHEVNIAVAAQGHDKIELLGV